MPHTVLIPDETLNRAADYLRSLNCDESQPGKRLQAKLAENPKPDITVPDFLGTLLNTKLPQIFAESAISGDGSDWNQTELGLLGDISIPVPVTVFDNANHTAPVIHPTPFQGTLVYTPGALLRNDRGHTPADWTEVTEPGGRFDPEGYYRLYERRLLPVFRYINQSAAAKNKPALITIPGLGCGCFAGPFAGSLGKELETVLRRFLEKHGAGFPDIGTVYFDPFNECENMQSTHHGISLRTRPLLQGNQRKSQLCPPTAFEETGDDFSGCLLFSIVAWDHVSWPGNDFFAGSRCTDDGVKAAATDSMYAITGVEGSYNTKQNAYLPPSPFRNWAEVVLQNNLRL
ncbi:hypothetical protein [Luteolibacter sp. AS25]|uniref:hypothetical protein n=1 Tax=Luteolibacter sp. AS25 TaxID=3135776 RepID=UPI00398AAFD1